MFLCIVCVYIFTWNPTLSLYAVWSFKLFFYCWNSLMSHSKETEGCIINSLLLPPPPKALSLTSFWDRILEAISAYTNRDLFYLPPPPVLASVFSSPTLPSASTQNSSIFYIPYCILHFSLKNNLRHSSTTTYKGLFHTLHNVPLIHLFNRYNVICRALVNNTEKKMGKNIWPYETYFPVEIEKKESKEVNYIDDRRWEMLWKKTKQARGIRCQSSDV